MANDLMRTGPKGSTGQSSWLGPMQVMINDGLAATGTGSGVNVDASSAVTGTVAATWQPTLSSVTYRVVSISVRVCETMAANCTINIGSANASGVVDADGIVNDFVVPNTTAAGTVLSVPLNGAGTAASRAITSLQWVALISGASGGDGRFQVYMMVEPVGGGSAFFSNA